MIRFLINIPDSLHRKLKIEALAKGQTLTGFIRSIRWDWVERKEES